MTVVRTGSLDLRLIEGRDSEHKGSCLIHGSKRETQREENM